MEYTLAFISGGELIIVFLVFLLLFGSSKVPELAKGLGKGLREFKKATDDIKREIDSSTNEISREINKNTNEISREINKSTTDFKKDMSDMDRNMKAE